MDCYSIPSFPVPLMLPADCVAEVVAKPKIDALEESRANWMRGHVTWRNQRIPVMSFSALNDPTLDERKKRKAHLVVLNPVPDAVRKAYSGIICYGDVTSISVDDSATYTELPEAVDRRYAEAAVNFQDTDFVIPKLSALAVAFSYF